MKLLTRHRCVYFLPLLHVVMWGAFTISPSLWAQQPNDSAVSSDKPAQNNSSEKTGPWLALVGAQVRTYGGGGVLEQGVVLIQNGKIAAVGAADLEIPKGAEVLDLSGMVMTPGLIDARSELWLTDAAADSGASDASLDVLDGVDPFSEDWHEVVRQGVTSVYIQPSSRGALGGYGAVLCVVPRQHINADAVPGPEQLAAQSALQASFPAANNRARKQHYDRTKKLLDEAVAYRKSWDEYEAYMKKKEAAEKQKKPEDEKTTKSTGEKPPAPGTGSGPGAGSAGRSIGRPDSPRPVPPSQNAEVAKAVEAKADGKPAEEKKEEKKEEAKPPKKPELDPSKERLSKVVKGQIPVRLEIQSADDAHFAAKLHEDFKELQVILEGGRNLPSETTAISASHNPLVLGPWLFAESQTRSDLDSVSNWGASFSDYQGAIAIGTFGNGPRSSRLLRAHVGQAIANGFDAERAMRAVTIDAARILGIGDQLGSIEVGKRADLACFYGEPSNASKAVGLVLVAGKVAFRASNTEAVASSLTSADPKEFEKLSLSGPLPTRVALKTSRCLLPNGSIEQRVIVIEKGVIKEVHPGDAHIAEGTLVIDLGHALLTPGLFSAHATLGLERLVDSQSQVDSAHIVAGDCLAGGFDGEDELLQSGVLQVLLAPGDSNPVAGMASLIRLGASDPVIERMAAVKLVLASRSRRTDRYPASLAGQLQMIHRSFEGELLPSRVYLPASVESRLVALRTESLADAAGGKQWVVIIANTDAEVRGALDLIEKHSMRAMLVGPKQLKPFMDRIKALDVTLVASPALPNDYAWAASDLSMASRAGIPLLFSGESAEQLRLTASLAVEAGMSPDLALAALCGVSSNLATHKIQPDASADMVVWSASPVNLAAKPLMIVVDGKLVKSEAE